MTPADLKGQVFLSPEQVGALWGKDARFAYRHAVGKGFLRPYARRFGRSLYFYREGVLRLINSDSGT
jgi:hypothetical protein